LIKLGSAIGIKMGVIEMQIAASDIMEKMIKKLRKSQGELAAGASDKESMKATLISVKVYCDLLLEEIDEVGTVKESVIPGLVGKKSVADVDMDAPVKRNKPKVVPFEDDEDANGDSIFDF
jgi:hypothetical protein